MVSETELGCKFAAQTHFSLDTDQSLSHITLMCEAPHSQNDPSSELLTAVARDLERAQEERQEQEQREIAERFLQHRLAGMQIAA